MTFKASVGVCGDRRMVTFQVVFFGHFQDILGAVLDTEPTAFASFFYDMDITARDLNLICVQWFPPMGHIISLVLLYAKTRPCQY
jgi:hypothetical protein